MTDIAKCTATLPFSSSLSYGPYATNTFYVGWNGIEGGSFALAATRGRQAYLNMFNTVGPDGTIALGHYLSTFLNGNVTFRAWDLNNPTFPGEDGDEGFITTLDASAPNLPTQVASCISTRCAPQAGWARQSTYNRMYIGPLNSNTLNDEGAADGRPDAAFMLNMVEGYRAFYDTFDILGIDQARPVVYSGVQGDGHPVVNWFTDNSFDIQRRRKLETDFKVEHTV
jgi:hypothetical protein